MIKISIVALILLNYLFNADKLLAQETQSVSGSEARVQRLDTSSGHFTILGADNKTRVAFAQMAENLREGFLSALNVSKEENWKWPIVIQLHGREGEEAPARTLVFEPYIIGDGWTFRLHVHLARGIDVEAIQNELIKALLMEKALRDVNASRIEGELLIPVWLIVGIREAIEWKRGLADRTLYEAVLKSGSLMELQELFELKEQGSLDPVGRTSLKVSSGALTIALLGQKADGKPLFDRFLTEVPEFDGEMAALLRKHFPGINLSQNSLVKYWQLQMAQLSTPLVVDVMTVSETEKRLQEILIAYLRDETGGIREVPLSNWQTILAEDKLQQSLRQMSQNLLQMSYRSFPLYRSILQEYQNVLYGMMTGKEQDVDKKLKELQQARSVLVQEAERARDYLDWYEINNGLVRGESFERFLQLKEELRGKQVVKTDPLSSYLDDMQRFFEEEESSK